MRTLMNGIASQPTQFAVEHCEGALRRIAADPERAEAIFMECERVAIGHRNMLGDSSRLLIECVEAATARHPKCSLPVYTGEIYVVTAKARGILCIMCVSSHVSVGWIKSEQSLGGRQPQFAITVFTDVDSRTIAFISALRANAKVCECFRDWVEFVERLVAADPKSSRMIDEKTSDVGAAQTLRLAGLMAEYLKPVAVESIQAVLRAEPEKSQPILNGPSRSGLRQSVHGRDGTKPDVAAIN